MAKNLLVPEIVLVDTIRLLIALERYELDADTYALAKRVETAIYAKVDAMDKRRAYTEYKTASSPDARENARQKYLDLAGIHEDWQWNAETDRKRLEDSDFAL